MTVAERLAICKKNKIVWEHADNAQVDNIHMTEAYRTAMDIKKYKPEYESRGQRAAIRA